jgi:hypothetical protein
MHNSMCAKSNFTFCQLNLGQTLTFLLLGCPADAEEHAGNGRCNAGRNKGGGSWMQSSSSASSSTSQQVQEHVIKFQSVPQATGAGLYTERQVLQLCRTANHWLPFPLWLGFRFLCGLASVLLPCVIFQQLPG